MVAKDYLHKVKRLDVLADHEVEELQMLRHKAKGINAISYDKDTVQTSGSNSSPQERIADLLVDQEQKTLKAIDEFIAYKEKVKSEINLLQNILHVQILLKLYIEYKTIQEIADETYHDYDYIKHQHGYALSSFWNLHTKKTPKDTKRH